MSLLSALADELTKTAVLSVPKIPTTAIGATASSYGSTTKSGVGVKIGKSAFRPVKLGGPSIGTPGAVRIAASGNLGTSVSPRTTTVPKITGGGTRVQ